MDIYDDSLSEYLDRIDEEDTSLSDAIGVTKEYVESKTNDKKKEVVRSFIDDI